MDETLRYYRQNCVEFEGYLQFRRFALPVHVHFRTVGNGAFREQH